MDKQEIYDFLDRARQRSGQPFWGIGGLASDLSAAQRAGAAWLLVTHAASFPHPLPASVIGLLPYADANSVVLANPPPRDAAIPVFAAAFAGDQFRTQAMLLKELRRAGFAALQNFPSVLLAEGKYKAFLDAADMGYAREVELIRRAAEAGFFTSALAGSEEQAEQMLYAGADQLVFHLGLNADGEHRDWNASSRKRFAAVRSLAEKISPHVLLARSGYLPGDWPPSAGELGLGVQYDGNLRQLGNAALPKPGNDRAFSQPGQSVQR